MSTQQSEGEVHVAAMRLILAAMERSEDPPDWTIWQHMLGMLDTIFQGVKDQRSDDLDELINIRSDRDHWRQARQDAIEAGELMQAECETLRKQLAAAHAVAFSLRKQLAAAQREASDEFAERQVLQHEASDDYVELERLRAFVEVMRGLLTEEYADQRIIAEALAELDAGTTEPAPVAEPLDAEGNQP